MYKAKLFYGAGDVILNSSANTMLIEITYKGNASLHTNLGRNWTFSHNKNKIIIINHKPSDLKDGIIFKYRGEFIPTSCKLIDADKNKSMTSIESQGIHFWESMDNNWETSDKYTKYKNTYKFRNPIKGVRNG